VQLFPGFLQFVLQLTPEQRKKADAFETEASRKLEEILTGAQRKQFKEIQGTPMPFGRGGAGELPEAGQIMTRSVRDRLKLTDDQKKQVDTLQSEARAKVEEILKDEQKKQLKDLQDRIRAFAEVAAGGMGRPGGRPGAFGAFPGMGGSALFRAYRYAANYPGLVGKELMPGMTIDESEAKPSSQKK
jgi:DNA-binding MarR family transcriptional regulator